MTRPSSQVKERMERMERMERQAGLTSELDLIALAPEALWRSEELLVRALRAQEEVKEPDKLEAKPEELELSEALEELPDEVEFTMVYPEDAILFNASLFRSAEVAPTPPPLVRPLRFEMPRPQLVTCMSSIQERAALTLLWITNLAVNAALIYSVWVGR